MVKYTQLTTIMILKASANPNDGFACLSTAVVFLVACIFLHVNLCIMIWKRRKNISINQILNSQKHIHVHQSPIIRNPLTMNFRL